MSLTGDKNAFFYLRNTIKAKYGCCDPYHYMSKPITDTKVFDKASQCSPCSGGSSVSNDDIACPYNYVCSCTHGVAAAGSICTADNAHICSSCSSGYYKNGNTCTACTSCESGQYTTGVCTGDTTTDTQSCAACFNGGSSYSCPPGKYITGNACPGSGDTDTQTCNDCVTGKYQTQNESNETSCKTCSFGHSATSATAACSVCASGQSQENGNNFL